MSEIIPYIYIYIKANDFDNILTKKNLRTWIIMKGGGILFTHLALIVNKYDDGDNVI